MRDFIELKRPSFSSSSLHRLLAVISVLLLMSVTDSTLAEQTDPGDEAAGAESAQSSEH